MTRVVITGASSGIGAACVRAFSNSGTEVIGIDKLNESGADEHLTVDLATPDCGRIVAQSLDGRSVDVLVNNAAVGFSKPAENTDSSQFDLVMAVNLRAPFLVSSALLPNLRAVQGVVVNVASVHAIATSTPGSAYAASKGGLVSLTRSLALEWAPEVRVNCVLPGAVDTEALNDGLVRAGGTIETLAHAHPLGRVGEPWEIADAVMFLSANHFVTGASLVVDGGATDPRLSTE